jgi:hypothetical protein
VAHLFPTPLETIILFFFPLAPAPSDVFAIGSSLPLEGRDHLPVTSEQEAVSRTSGRGRHDTDKGAACGVENKQRSGE